MTLRTRVLLGFSVVFVVVIAAAFVTVSAQRAQLYDQLDDLASVAINKLRATSLSSLMKQNSASDASGSEPNRMAAAGMVANGAAVNRMSTNGLSSNGALSNGASSNGAGSDGMATHAAGSNGFAASHANGHHVAKTNGHL